ncbi:GDSL esterase/lipase At5g45910 [Linum perenne]
MTINRATGRSSDGYILLDRIAEAVGVPYVNPYLNKSLDHTYGANFAVGGVGYLSKETRNKWDIHLPWSQSSVDVQMDWLEQHLNHTFPDAASRREHLKSALFLVGGGGNDYGSFRLYAANRSPSEQKRIIMPDVFDVVRAYLRKLIINYEIENIVVTGLYEGGCLVNWKFNDNQTHCHNDTNAYHILHNQILQQELQLLREEYPSVHLAYGDVWNAHQWLLDH